MLQHWHCQMKGKQCWASWLVQIFHQFPLVVIVSILQMMKWVAFSLPKLVQERICSHWMVLLQKRFSLVGSYISCILYLYRYLALQTSFLFIACCRCMSVLLKIQWKHHSLNPLKQHTPCMTCLAPLQKQFFLYSPLLILLFLLFF